MSPTPTDETVEATFAFVDLAGFTAVTEAHGDAEAVSIVRMFRDHALDVLRPGDELVKTIGDAVMLRFSTPEAAVAALRELLQREQVRPARRVARRSVRSGAKPRWDARA
jgi:adenylate cyclase